MNLREVFRIKLMDLQIIKVQINIKSKVFALIS